VGDPDRPRGYHLLVGHLLKEREERRRRDRESEYERVRTELRGVLRRVAGLDEVIVFGSLTHRGAFHRHSDVDLAIWREPPGWTYYGLADWIAEAVGHPVDVILLNETRLKEKILREGELWTL
jgi:predicted nucleotidyltransferase